jgi:IS6 family transposase
MQRNPFKHHRFPPDVILCAVRWYCRYALSCRDVRDLLSEHGIEVDASTIHLWVRKFGPEIAKRSFKHRSWRGLSWHVDETYIRVGAKWRYLWRAVDQRSQLVDFRLTACRDAKAAMLDSEALQLEPGQTCA